MQHAEGGRRPDQRPDLTSRSCDPRNQDPSRIFGVLLAEIKLERSHHCTVAVPLATRGAHGTARQPGSQSARAFFAKLGDSCPVIKSPISHAPHHREAGRLLVPSSSSAVASGVCNLARSVSKRGQRMLGSSRRSAAWSAA